MGVKCPYWSRLFWQIEDLESMTDNRKDHDLYRQPKQFVLCFDGTGNKFAGDTSDTNLVKIYRVRKRTPSEFDVTTLLTFHLSFASDARSQSISPVPLLPTGNRHIPDLTLTREQRETKPRQIVVQESKRCRIRLFLRRARPGWLQVSHEILRARRQHILLWF